MNSGASNSHFINPIQSCGTNGKKNFYRFSCIISKWWFSSISCALSSFSLIDHMEISLFTKYTHILMVHNYAIRRFDFDVKKVLYCRLHSNWIFVHFLLTKTVSRAQLIFKAAALLAIFQACLTCQHFIFSLQSFGALAWFFNGLRYCLREAFSAVFVSR